jgi:hypothetical protein
MKRIFVSEKSDRIILWEGSSYDLFTIAGDPATEDPKDATDVKNPTRRMGRPKGAKNRKPSAGSETVEPSVDEMRSISEMKRKKLVVKYGTTAVNKVIEMHQIGNSIEYIAEKSGLKADSVGEIIKDIGIS